MLSLRSAARRPSVLTARVALVQAVCLRRSAARLTSVLIARVALLSVFSAARRSSVILARAALIPAACSLCTTAISSTLMPALLLLLLSVTVGAVRSYFFPALVVMHLSVQCPTTHTWGLRRAIVGELYTKSRPRGRALSRPLDQSIYSTVQYFNNSTRMIDPQASISVHHVASCPGSNYAHN